ncbi:MAG TPA: HAD family hydrolase [Spirochaetota bacterium]|nr:HAD family hydrolase [Spirochaetota bacterium]HPJ37676.1 HAD family hydrolase [Spirochaetota bacterium]HPQ53531.1 HAD family hydrolase [Spirochaetota bacterium]
MAINGILFDLDGTLIDTIGDLTASVNAVFTVYNIPELTNERMKQVIGDGIDSLIRSLLPPEYKKETEITAIVNAVRDEYSTRWNNTSVPYPGIPELLDTLTAKGILMSVLSNKPDEFTGIMIQTILPGWHFESVQGSRPDLPRKPDPATALTIAAHMKLNPADIMLVGDSGSDMETAVRAGMTAAGVSWGYRSTFELSGKGAHIIFDKPEEIISYI